MNVSQSIKTSFSKSFTSLASRKDILYILIFILALVAFEAFNFSTTDFALSDVLGDLRFAGIRWATLLSIAFCGIDFAGISRLFAPQTENESKRNAWFMFGAWILAATMNAILTWWGVVMAMQTHTVLSVGVMNKAFVSDVVPIFIALMVWVIRILLIGILSRESKKMFSDVLGSGKSGLSRRELRQAQSRAAHSKASTRSVPAGFSKASAGKAASGKSSYQPEPQYFPMQNEGVAYRSLKASRSNRR
jgi:signal transduction histidine kinase